MWLEMNGMESAEMTVAGQGQERYSHYEKKTSLQ
jgi:hypothetical protein